MEAGVFIILACLSNAFCPEDFYMTLRELQDQALMLSAEERWKLIDTLMRSLKPKPRSKVKPKGLAASLIGIAKTDGPPPTDAEVKAMLDERLVQKYL